MGLYGCEGACEGGFEETITDLSWIKRHMKGRYGSMNRHLLLIVIVSLFFIPLHNETSAQIKGKGSDIVISLKSPAFEAGKMIPDVYTCKGKNISPPLTWSNIPKETKSICIICDDPDAPVGIWVHWVIYNIPGDAKGLSEGMPCKETLKDGTVQGRNDFYKTGYGGPCPPFGNHRYFFKIYALDTRLDLKPGVNKKCLLKAMEGHVLGQGQLMGRYKK
jgi:Raf kinase inhibitor-like YbhB/YbcL family protein